jgi:hypothetical protein
MDVTMRTDTLKRILADVGLPVDAASVSQLGGSAWAARTAEGPIVVRLVQRSDVNALRAVRCLQDGSPERLALLQRLLRCVDVDCGVLAVMEWLPGVTLRNEHRDELPAFFERLASWHRENAGATPLYSRYTGREYPTVEEYLSDELSFHLKTASGVVSRAVCWSCLKPLSRGFPTYVHGDVHPGNIVRQPDSTYRLLDPEYLHIGVNYLDLDYVDWHGLEQDPRFSGD